MTPKPTSPVTSTRAGDEMSGEPVAWQRRPLFGEVRIWTECESDAEDQDFWREQEYEIRPLYAAANPDSQVANSIQANSSASEKVCDHPSTEKAAWRDTSSAPHGVAVLLGWRDYFTTAWVNEVGFASSGWSRNGVSTKSQHGQATHWMPLPASPDGQVIGGKK